MFIVDFYCHAAKLVVELDGEIHLQHIEYDKERTGILKEFGIDVIRFSNSEILKNIDNVIVQIEGEVKVRLERQLNPVAQSDLPYPLTPKGERSAHYGRAK